jgi:site-specific recombinase XerD
VENNEEIAGPQGKTANVLLFPAATPEKRKRVPRMSRRAQDGSIEKSGKWYVARFWKDVAGQETRVHACERICPINGPGSLTKAERKRKQREIIAQSGVNNPDNFGPSTCSVTFREQASRFIQHAMTRKRSPVKPATVCSWESCLKKWLNPNLGDSLLSSVNNNLVKTLVGKMHTAGLSAKSIHTYVGLIKLTVASAIDENGEQLFPRQWNHEFLDMPIIGNQHQPLPTAEIMSSIIANAAEQEANLYAMLAGAGLRVGEALGLEVRHFSSDFETITVEQSAHQQTIQEPKTKNAKRQVDLCPELAAMMKDFIGTRTSGLVFRNRAGNIISQRNLLARSLHPILAKLGVQPMGFHAMRRFRTTWLRKQRAPEDLIRFWLGHAERDVTDSYSKLKEDVQFRKEIAFKVGSGFAVSVRSVRRNGVEPQSEIAA